MQKEQPNPPFKTEEEFEFHYQVDEGGSTLVRSNSNSPLKRWQKVAHRSIPGWGSNLTRFIIYMFVIVLGLLVGRWLSPSTQPTLNEPTSTTVIPTSAQSSTQPSSTQPSSTQPSSSLNPIITATGFACPAPQSPFTTTSTELNLLVWTEYLPNDWFECFEATYGVKVTRTEYSSNEEMLEILASSATPFDLIQPGDQSILGLIAAGKIQKLDKTRLSVFNNFNPAFLNLPFDPGNEYTIPYQTGSASLAVNTDQVANLPNSWADLWKPTYTGRILLIEDPRYVIALTLLAMGYPVNTTDPADLEAIKPKLAQLVKATKTFNSDSQRSDILSGVVDLGLFWNGEAALAQRESKAIHYIYPSEGAILWQDNYAIPTHAQHSDATYAWINYTMQGDLFWMMLRDFPYINPNQASLDFAKTDQPTLYADYINSTITNVSAQAMLNGHWLVDLGDAQALYDKLWAEVKGT